MPEWLVSLDFGTTATAVAVCSGDGPVRALVFSDGSSTVPSSVFAEGPGRLLVGVEADNEAEMRLGAYEPTPKRRISDGQIRLGDTDFSVPEVIGAVIAPLLSEAMHQCNNSVPSQIVLTHPVAWRARRRAVLAEAVKSAQTQLGVTLPQPEFIAEPVAAARWYARTDQPRPGEYFAVYDLGGGTFDTAVLQVTDDGFEVIASGGIDPLGGFDFDAALLDYLGNTYIQPASPGLWAALSTPGQADPDLARQRRRLQQRVGLLKTGLSTSPDKRIQLPGVQGAVVVTRGEYEALISGYVDDTIV
jgi:molecular chaperone DnaK (HSP70)